MSELFACRVTAVSKTSAKIAVRSVHPDSGPPQPNATFALMIVYDPIMSSAYSDMREYTHLEGSPLAQEMDRDNYLDPAWIRENARAFVAKAKVSKGVLEVWPTHPAWIEHLRTGMAWDTAAYSNGEGDPVDPRAPTPPPEGPIAHSRNPAEGFRVGAPKYEKEFPDIKEAFIPQESASRYVADPVITGVAEMAKAAATMIGQPILFVPQRGPKQVGTILGATSEYMQVYHEDTGGYGYGSESFTDLKSFGRAWLKEKTVPTLVPKAAAKKPAKKAPVKKTAAKRAKKPAKRKKKR